MSRYRNSQPEAAVATTGVPYASRKSPRASFTSQTTGVFRTMLPCVTEDEARILNELAPVYLRSFNATVLALRSGQIPARVSDPVEARAVRDARRASRKVRRSLRVRSEARMGTLPIVGAAAALLGASLDRSGVAADTVLNARFRKVTYGTGWAACVTIQGEPSERDLMGFAHQHAHPSWCADLGVAAMPDGLHVSELAIRDARGSAAFKAGQKPTRYGRGAGEFMTGQKPTRYIVAFEKAQGFLDQLLQRKVRPRSLTLDRSCVETLSRTQKAQLRALVGACRGRLAVGAVVYRDCLPVGQEAQECRDRLKLCGFTDRELDSEATHVHLECPQCEALLSLKLNPKTWLPRIDRQTRCTSCGCLFHPGDLLADRARGRGVAGWEHDVASTAPTVAAPDPGPRANVDKDATCEAKAASLLTPSPRFHPLQDLPYTRCGIAERHKVEPPLAGIQRPGTGTRAVLRSGRSEHARAHGPDRL